MRTITLTVFNRPDCLARMLESLRKNKLDGYVLYVGVEPGDDRVLQMIRAIDFVETRVVLNGVRLGVRENPFQLVGRAVNDGSEFNVYLEDDLVISPDAFDLMEWFRVLPSRDAYLYLCLMRYGSSPSSPLAVSAGQEFAPIGWCCTARAWREQFSPAWHADARGWDFSVLEHLRRGGLKLLRPAWARVTHTGGFGTYMRPDLQEQQFGNHSYSDGSHRVGYVIQ